MRTRGRHGKGNRITARRALSNPLSNPWTIARALADRPGLAVLASGAPGSPYGRFSYVASDPVEHVASLDPLGGRAAPGSGGQSPWWIGVLPYEALRAANERPSWSRPDERPSASLRAIEWSRFDAVAVIDHEDDTAWVEADDDAAAACLAERIGTPSGSPAPFDLRFEDDEEPERHVERVATVIERIFDGELYQVNLARRLAVTVSPAGPAALLAAGEALFRASPTAFGAFLRLRSGHAVMCTSPELLLDAAPSSDRTSFGRLVTEPIKGTRRRARDEAEDRRLVEELDADPKERAELAMIIDVERNDLSRVCERGTVTIDEPPHVVSHATVHHRVAKVSGLARAGLSREQVLASIVPSGSVTGAPKVRAMETIAELEPKRRGLYTGGIGFMTRTGAMRLAMAIRTCVVDAGGLGEYLVGGGIVADSDPDRELAETRWKSAQLASVARSRAQG